MHSFCVPGSRERWSRNLQVSDEGESEMQLVRVLRPSYGCILLVAGATAFAPPIAVPRTHLISSSAKAGLSLRQGHPLSKGATSYLDCAPELWRYFLACCEYFTSHLCCTCTQVFLPGMSVCVTLTSRRKQHVRLEASSARRLQQHPCHQDWLRHCSILIMLQSSPSGS